MHLFLYKCNSKNFQPWNHTTLFGDTTLTWVNRINKKNWLCLTLFFKTLTYHMQCYTRRSGIKRRARQYLHMSHCILKEYKVHGCVHFIVTIQCFCQNFAEVLPSWAGQVLRLSHSRREMRVDQGLGIQSLFLDILKRESSLQSDTSQRYSTQWLTITVI